MPEQKLKDKVAVIGADAKNLGGLISRNLGAEGASVAVHYTVRPHQVRLRTPAQGVASNATPVDGADSAIVFALNHRPGISGHDHTRMVSSLFCPTPTNINFAPDNSQILWR
jgi:hypothetical protein